MLMINLRLYPLFVMASVNFKRKLCNNLILHSQCCKNSVVSLNCKPHFITTLAMYFLMLKHAGFIQ